MIDLATKGRLVLSIGAGYQALDYQAFGVPAERPPPITAMFIANLSPLPSGLRRIPGPDTAEPFGLDPSDPARLFAKGLRWKDRVGAQVEARETLQEGRGTAFRDPRLALHDEILLESQWVRAGAEAREHDTRVSLNVLHLLMEGQVKEPQCQPGRRRSACRYAK